MSRVRYAAPEKRRALDNRLASPETPAMVRERRELDSLLRSKTLNPLSFCRRSAGRSWLVRTAPGIRPNVPIRLFPGRPDDFNSIFVDGTFLFSQMDVWSRCCVDPIFRGSQSTLRQHTGTGFSEFALQINLLLKVRGSVFSLDKSLSWMSQGAYARAARFGYRAAWTDPSDPGLPRRHNSRSPIR